MKSRMDFDGHYRKPMYAAEAYKDYLRTYVAAMAMQGLLASGIYAHTDDKAYWLCTDSINYADKLLSELEKSPENHSF